MYDIIKSEKTNTYCHVSYLNLWTYILTLILLFLFSSIMVKKTSSSFQVQFEPLLKQRFRRKPLECVLLRQLEAFFKIIWLYKFELKSCISMLPLQHSYGCWLVLHLIFDFNFHHYRLQLAEDSYPPTHSLFYEDPPPPTSYIAYLLLFQFFLQTVPQPVLPQTF